MQTYLHSKLVMSVHALKTRTTLHKIHCIAMIVLLFIVRNPPKIHIRLVCAVLVMKLWSHLLGV